MNVTRIVRTLDFHVAGWPLRLVEDFSFVSGKETLSAQAERLWTAVNSPVRWLQREPRGHAAMRVGVLAASERADAALLVFDADGVCPPDGMDALCAAAALTEKGVVPRSQAVTLATASGIVRIGAVKETDAARSIALRAEIGNSPYTIVASSEIGIPLLPDNAAKLEQFAREGRQEGKSILYLQERNEARSDIIVAEIGRSGKLLRAPSGGAIGALLAMRLEKDRKFGEPAPVQGLSGGAVEAVALEEVEGEDGSLRLEWELRAQPRCIGSCEFVADPADSIGEGFLLR